MAIFLQLVLCECEGLLVDQCGHRNLDPILAWPLVVGAVAGRQPIALAQGTCDPLSRSNRGLAVAGLTLIGGIAQQRPHGRALPPRISSARGNLLLVEMASNRIDAQTRTSVKV